MSVRSNYLNKIYWIVVFCCCVVSSQAQKKGILDSVVRIDVSQVSISTALNRIYYLKSNQKVDIATGELKFDKTVTLADTAKLKDILAQLLYRESFEPIDVDSLNVVSIDTAYNLIEKIVIKKDTVKIEVPKMVSLHRDSIPLSFSIFLPLPKTQKGKFNSPFGFSLVYKTGKNMLHSESNQWDLHLGISYSAYFAEQQQSTEVYKTYIKEYKTVPSMQVVTENGKTVIYNYETKVPVLDSVRGTVNFTTRNLYHLLQIGGYAQYKFAKTWALNGALALGEASCNRDFYLATGLHLGLSYENKKKFKGLALGLGVQVNLLIPNTLFLNPALSIGLKHRF